MTIHAGARSAARLGAVQALYQMEMSEIGDDAVIREFEDHRFDHDNEDLKLSQADRAHFERIVKGVVARQSEVDQIVNGVLKAGWPLARLDATIRSIMRAGAFELVACAEIDTATIIDEYVEIAKDFFSADQPGFVNGVLDQIAKRARANDSK